MRPEVARRGFDVGCDFVRCLHHVGFDVDHTDPYPYGLGNVLQVCRVFDSPAFEFKDEMVRPQRGENRDQVLPRAFLNGLASVVPEADVYRFFDLNRVEYGV